MYEDVYNIVELTPGAEEFCAVLQGLGYRLAVISGGECTHPLVPLLLLFDFCYYYYYY